MARAYVAVGSNIEPARNVREAVRLLAQQEQVVGISTIYRTAPLGRPEQQHYYNCVVAIETDADPLELRANLRLIEAQLGRVRTEDAYAPRTIDLDLILYDDLALTIDDLMLPDPDIVRRPFLAIPLWELAPDLVLPESGVRISELAETLPRGDMKPVVGYTEQLRREVMHGPGAS